MIQQRLKYVRTSYGFIIADDRSSHDQMVTVFPIKPTVLSAGFFYMQIENNNLVVKTYGKSISLNTEPLDDDAEKLKEFLLQ